MPVTTSPTMNEPTTTATARVAVLNDTHQQASSTELEDFYTTYYHLAPPTAGKRSATMLHWISGLLHAPGRPAPCGPERPG